MITLDGTNGITTPDVDSDGLTVDTNTLFVDAANNRVGVGTSSPFVRLHVAQSATAGESRAVIHNSSGSSGDVSALYFSAIGSEASTLSRAAAIKAVIGSSNEHSLLFFTNAAFADPTERARIDASGNLLVGTTTVTLGSVANFFKTATAGNQRVASFINNGTPGTFSPAGLFINYPNAAGGNGSTFLQCSDGTTDRLYILGSGNVQNVNNSYGAISDAKLKENVVDATPKLEKLNQVRIVNFNLIGEEQKQIGVIAQELEQIFPSIVEEAIDRDAEGNDLGTTTKSVKYSVFVPMLIKAMQEQQAIIEALEARVAALETNA